MVDWVRLCVSLATLLTLTTLVGYRCRFSHRLTELPLHGYPDHQHLGSTPQVLTRSGGHPWPTKQTVPEIRSLYRNFPVRKIIFVRSSFCTPPSLQIPGPPQPLLLSAEWLLATQPSGRSGLVLAYRASRCSLLLPPLLALPASGVLGRTRPWLATSRRAGPSRRRSNSRISGDLSRREFIALQLSRCPVNDCHQRQPIQFLWFQGARAPATRRGLLAAIVLCPRRSFFQRAGIIIPITTSARGDKLAQQPVSTGEGLPENSVSHLLSALGPPCCVSLRPQARAAFLPRDCTYQLSRYPAGCLAREVVLPETTGADCLIQKTRISNTGRGLLQPSSFVHAYPSPTREEYRPLATATTTD